MRTTLKNLSALTFLAIIFASPLAASATPFVIKSELTGDSRPDSLDFLNIDVTITGDTDSEFTNWLVDLDMAATYPGAELHEFYINLAVGDPDTDYEFSLFSPSNWAMTDTDGNNANGSGNMEYMFQIDDNTHNVTNTTPLSFTLKKLSGDFLISDFISTAPECGAAGCGQLGAHIGALAAGKSGFAVGNYALDTGRVITAIPEPMSLTLVGSGLVALAARARRRRQA